MHRVEDLAQRRLCLYCKPLSLRLGGPFAPIMIWHERLNELSQPSDGALALLLPVKPQAMRVWPAYG
jgi:hypothetical protein